MKKKLAYSAVIATLVLSSAAHALGPGAHMPVDIGMSVGLCDNYDHWSSPPWGEERPYWRPCIGI